MVQFESLGAVSYSHSIATMAVSTQYTNATLRQTPIQRPSQSTTARRYRARLSIASREKCCTERIECNTYAACNTDGRVTDQLQDRGTRTAVGVDQTVWRPWRSYRRRIRPALLAETIRVKEAHCVCMRTHVALITVRFCIGRWRNYRDQIASGPVVDRSQCLRITSVQPCRIELVLSAHSRDALRTFPSLAFSHSEQCCVWFSSNLNFVRHEIRIKINTNTQTLQ